MTKKYGYYVQQHQGRDKIAFVEDTQETVGVTAEKWSTIKDDGVVARIYGSKIPTNLTLDAVKEELPLPHFVDEAALNFIISEGYLDPRNMNPNLAQAFNTKSTASLREARKKFARRKQKGGFIKPVDF